MSGGWTGILMRMSRFLGLYPNLDMGDEQAGWEEDQLSSLVFDLREGCFSTVAPLHRDFLLPNEARLIRLMMRMDYPTMHLYRLSRHDRQRIVEILLRYYRLHIPQFPELKSLQVLQELWD